MDNFARYYEHFFFNPCIFLHSSLIHHPICYKSAPLRDTHKDRDTNSKGQSRVTHCHYISNPNYASLCHQWTQSKQLFVLFPACRTVSYANLSPLLRNNKQARIKDFEMQQAYGVIWSDLIQHKITATHNSKNRVTQEHRKAKNK